MGFIRFIDSKSNQLAHPDPALPVLKAEQARLLVEQSRIVAQATEQGARITAAAQEAFEAERRRGYEEGMEEAKMEQAERMIESVTRTVDFFSNVEGQMVDLVMESVRKIVEGFDDHERVLVVVRNAIAVVRNQKQITLRLHPTQVETVKAHMHQLLSEYQGVGHLDVVSDSRLGVDACILESEIGTVEASIAGQLLALRKAFDKVLGSRV